MHTRATIGFGFTSDWFKKRRENQSLNQSLSEVMQTQSNSLITVDTQLKTALVFHSTYLSVTDQDASGLTPVHFMYLTASVLSLLVTKDKCNF